jgi:hypothetical protein
VKLLARATHATRWLLLGSDDAWGARVGTGKAAIYTLAVLAVLAHALDLATGLRMMLAHGVELEQNPLARLVMRTSGPLGLVEMKLGIVLLGVVLFVRTAQAGRGRLARNCLVFAACVGLLGATSNLI